MNKLLLSLTVTLGLSGVFYGSTRLTAYLIDDAIAEGVADAGVATPPLAHEVVPDPVADPEQAVRVVHEFAKREALWATVALVVFLLALAASNIAKTDSRLSFLKNGRWPAILGTVVGCSGAAVDYGQGQVTYMAVIMTAVTAAAALLSPSHVPKKPE